MEIKKLITNRKAYYEYAVLDTISAGIQLKGSEIKPIKSSHTSITEAYCYINNGEVFIKGMYVGQHEGKIQNYTHDSTRDRKLLLKKNEIKRLQEKIGEKGLTLIPLQVFLNEKGLIKILIGLCKGKNVRDKKIAIKEKDLKKDLKNSLGE